IALLGLVALGVAGLYAALRLSPIDDIPDDPEEFRERFGLPDRIVDTEQAGEKVATRSLVYDPENVRAVFTLAARTGKWSFAGFREATADRLFDAQQAIKALDLREGVSRFPVRPRWSNRGNRIPRRRPPRARPRSSMPRLRPGR